MKTWSSGRLPDETCPACGSVYTVTVERFPAKDKGRFKCEVCGEVVREWHDTYDWTYVLKSRVDAGHQNAAD